MQEPLGRLVDGGGGAAPTLTVTNLVTLPPALLAVRVYVVVVAGDTVMVPAAGTLPTLGYIVTEVASEVVHSKVADAPAVMELGEALKAAIFGGGVGVGVVPGGAWTVVQPMALTKSKHIDAKIAILFIL